MKNSHSTSKIIKKNADEHKLKATNKNHSSTKSMDLNQLKEEIKDNDYNLDKEREIFNSIIETINK